MPERLVLDASAALAFLRNEPRRAEVAELLARHLAAGGAVMVPEIFWLEVTNVLVRRHMLSFDDVLAALRNLDEFGIETVAGDRSLTILGLDLMVTHGLSAYDAAYLALAIAEDARLLTVDTRLDRAAGGRSALGHSPGVHETPAPYGSAAVADPLATHGAFLAELRRQAEAGVLR
jgi:predicted nucleic acid-binding protein